MSARSAAGLSGCAPCRLRRHGHSASIHSRLRACGAARCACLRGIGARPIPAARAWRPSMPPNRRCRIGPASAPPQWTELANTLVLAAAGCANACRPQRWRFSPITSRRTVHGHPARHRYGASTHPSRPAPQGAAGAFSPVIGVLTWPASGGEPVQPPCGDAEPALSPFGAVRPKASLSRCESWRWRGCASGFMAATVRRKQFPLRCAHSSRDKFFSPPGSPLRCDRKRCSPPVPRRPDHNKDAMGANLVQP